jgi:hypothetical protein
MSRSSAQKSAMLPTVATEPTASSTPKDHQAEAPGDIHSYKDFQQAVT